MKLKRILAAAAAATMLVTGSLSLSSCQKDDEEGKYTIGICQQAPHEALVNATTGFKDAIVEALGEENVTFLEQDAAGESTVCTTIVNDFVSKNVDLILGNATSALQAAANATTTIPSLGTSITEYGTALEIENFDGTVGGNISGTSDLAPLDEQAQMIIDLVPTAQTVGLLYCSAEPNSAYQVEVVRAYLEDKGLTVEDYKFSDSNDVAQVAAAAAAKCDAIYIPTDNKAADCTETINNTVLPTKTPIIAGEAGICGGCGIATLSIDYYNLGRITGEMAVKILTGESDISEMPIEYDTTPTKKYNPTICEELGITVPEDYQPLD